ncbi:MAG TPA: hypothetical protein VHE34_09995 [Puia sp.]|uniref:hypothetical protein n=1 Tax=Puia sp. TaxID=2045100 RepID=UPI002BDD4A84|nr:hypothetical protein [Puia sp.]HVU95547.1 hypothetical protein [Puia sp.]
MYVKEINDVKEVLSRLKDGGIVSEWALPYENLLTRLTAAIFFVTPAGKEDAMEHIVADLESFDNFSYRVNHERKLSDLRFRVTFSAEEKEKNDKASMETTTTN